MEDKWATNSFLHNFNPACPDRNWAEYQIIHSGFSFPYKSTMKGLIKPAGGKKREAFVLSYTDVPNQP